MEAELKLFPAFHHDRRQTPETLIPAAPQIDAFLTDYMKHAKPTASRTLKTDLYLTINSASRIQRNVGNKVSLMST